jgi:hypothetical protein
MINESLLDATLFDAVGFAQTSKHPSSIKDHQLPGDNLDLNDINQMLATIKKTKASHIRPEFLSISQNYEAKPP